MDIMMNRRSILRSAAGIGAGAALTTAVPFTIATDTTDTTTTVTTTVAGTPATFADSHNWPVGRDWSDSGYQSPLHIRPDSPHYKAVFEFMRRSKDRRDEWRPGVGQHCIEWVWALPEPMREAYIALFNDITGAWQTHIKNEMSNVLCGWVSAQGVTCENEDGEWIPATEDQMCDALSQPTTMAAAIMAMCEALELPIGAWLNAKDAVALERAAKACNR
jgi:hypothetical protein